MKPEEDSNPGNAQLASDTEETREIGLGLLWMNEVVDILQ